MTPEQRAARIHHHTYETCEGIAEHAERFVALEELCANIFLVARSLCMQIGCERCRHCQLGISSEYCELGTLRFGPMTELGIEVPLEHD